MNSVFRPFSIYCFCDNEKDELCKLAIDTGPTLSDKPDRPPRTKDQKIEDSFFGFGLELWYKRSGFKNDPWKFRDVIGEGFEDEYCNGKIEVKTIRQPSLGDAYDVIRKMGDKTYNFIHFWVCDRDNLFYYPAYVLKRGSDIVVKNFIKDLG